jgi:hypothetical protein
MEPLISLFSVRRTENKRRQTSTSSPSSSDTITSTIRCLTCGGICFLLTCSTKWLNHIGSLSSLLCRSRNQIYKVQMKSETYCLLSNEGAPKHTDTLTNHTDIKLLLLEIRNDVVEVGSSLNSKRSHSVHSTEPYFDFGFRECEERQSNINETIFKVLKFLLAINDL